MSTLLIEESRQKSIGIYSSDPVVRDKHIEKDTGGRHQTRSKSKGRKKYKC